MTHPSVSGAGWKLITGDCVEVMRAGTADSVDAIVCDPPYGLEFMGKDWDRLGGNRTSKTGIGERETPWVSPQGWNRYRCANCGHLPHGGSPCKCGNQQLVSDNRMLLMQDWHYTWAVEALRVLKPGGYLLAFGGTRTYHRLVCALEDAGFEIRDTVAWLYGQGFPKSLNVSKAIDKAAGAKREVVGTKVGQPGYSLGQMDNPGGVAMEGNINGSLRHPEAECAVTAPATPDAARWEGWGTALKPAFEPIVVARKPLSERTVAANVLRWGTGALNIDACRIEGPLDPANEKRIGRDYTTEESNFGDSAPMGQKTHAVVGGNPAGRWPANVALDEEAAVLLDEQAGKLHAPANQGTDRTGCGGIWKGGAGGPAGYSGFSDSGGASRFFYVAKAGKKERNAGLPEDEKNDHPTVKPVALMRWLCRLVTPPSGRVLDPFTGSGSAGVAALQEHFEYIGIEKEPAYCAIAVARLWAAEDSVSDAKRQEE